MGTRAVERGEAAERVALGVRTLREARGLSQRGLADRLAEHGRPMLVSGVSKIETGERRVDVDDLVALATALGVSPGHLLTGEPDPMDTDLDEMQKYEEQLAPVARAAINARDAGVPLVTIIAYLYLAESMRPILAGLRQAKKGARRGER